MTAKDPRPVEPSALERPPLQTLIATSPPKGRGTLAAGLASVVFHVGIAILLVMVTLSVKEAAEDDDPEEVTFIKIEETPPPPPPPPPPQVQIQPQVTPPKGFQTLTTPVDIPTEIPPPDTIATVEADFSGEGVAGGIAAGVEGAPVEDVTYMMSQVSVLPKMTKIVKPDYPPMLKRQEIAGQVMLQVVVLPSGEIDPPTLKVVKSLHPQLDEAAKRALTQSKFSPAFYGGRPVRVVLLVPYVFSFE